VRCHGSRGRRTGLAPRRGTAPLVTVVRSPVRRPPRQGRHPLLAVRDIPGCRYLQKGWLRASCASIKALRLAILGSSEDPSLVNRIASL
jgi:hypothetical protein